MKEKIFFCCIGAQKSGTTWLGKALSKHPDIWVHPLKEIHYYDYLHSDKFSNEEIFNHRMRAWLNYLKDIKYDNFNPGKVQYQLRHTFSKIYDDNWYRNMFKPLPSHIKAYGELTPQYSRLNIKGFNHLKKNHPNVKIIFLMRHPKDRLHSALKMYIRNHKIKNNIDDQILLNFLRNPGNLQMSDYPTTLKNINSVFKKENILVKFYEDIFNSEQSITEFLVELCDFLYVDFEQKLFKNVISQQYNKSNNFPFSEKVLNEIDFITNGISLKVKNFTGRVPSNW